MSNAELTCCKNSCVGIFKLFLHPKRIFIFLNITEAVDIFREWELLFHVIVKHEMLKFFTDNSYTQIRYCLLDHLPNKILLQFLHCKLNTCQCHQAGYQDSKKKFNKRNRSLYDCSINCNNTQESLRLY